MRNSPQQLTRLALCFVAVLCFASGDLSQSQASINLNVNPVFSAGGFSASYLHSANFRGGTGTDVYLGTDANGPLKGGHLSTRLSGGLSGNWNSANNTLTGISGSINSRVGSLINYSTLESYANSLAGINSVTGNDLMQIVITDGGMGFAEGSSSAFTGGWLSYEILIDDGATADGFVSVTQGDFFFKPQAETRGTHALSPNRGTVNEFAVWGNNWMHDGMAAGTFTKQNRGDASSSDWDFLWDKLGYTAPEMAYRSNVNSGLRLGIDLYVSQDVPEPNSLLVWASIVGGMVVFTRRKSKNV